MKLWIGILISVMLIGSGLFITSCGSNNSPSAPTANPTNTPTSSNPYAYKTKWAILDPVGLAASAGGTVYVGYDSNTANGGSVQLFSTSGVFLGSWTSYGVTQFSYPDGVAISPFNGNIYVTDGSPGSVYEFTSAGATVTSWRFFGSSGLNYPNAVAVEPYGNVYITDVGLNKIDVFTAAGVTVNQWTADGSPHGIAIDPNTYNVYVCDWTNIVHEYTFAGSSVTQWSIPGSPVSIEGIAVDSSGNVYTTDLDTNMVHEFTSSGAPITQWGGTGSANGQLNLPFGISVVGGETYVSDYGNHRVQVFGP